MHFPGSHMLALVTEPASYPVSLADMKDHLRVTHSLEDDLIAAYIASAVETAEEELNRPIVSQVWDESFQRPARDVYLSKVPAVSLTSVTYYDADNVQQTAELSDFILFGDDNYAFVRSDNWPTAYDRPDAITIRYSAGYSTPPKAVNQALRLIVGSWYENRVDAVEKSLREIPRAASHLLSLHRLGWYG